MSTNSRRVTITTMVSLHETSTFLRGAERIIGQWVANQRTWPPTETTRASGLVTCEACHRALYDHPWATEPENLAHGGSHDGQPYPFLRRGCRGELWKL